jgi:diguanylate cyclase (GGDEF)-like protein
MMARDWDAALQCLDPLLTMEVELPQVLWCSVWLTHARLLHERGDAAGAREAAAKAETFAEPPRPGEPRTYDLRRRAEIAELLGRVEESLALYRRYHQRAQGVLSAAISARLVEFHERFAQKELVLENDALRQQNAALGVGLQNLSQIATTDPLTGLLNRRGLDAEVSALIAAGHPFALALVDVDHFKRINDGYSHVLGDRVLVGLAQSMVCAMREGDRLARYGGEEFAVLLPGAGWTQAGGVAERLRSEVEAHDWTSLAPGLAVTVSVGVAVGHPGADFASVLATADDMLYRAKAAGRNRVVGLPVAGAH